MKKLAAFLLTAALLASLFAFPAFATYKDNESTDYVQGGTNAYDLGIYGLHIFTSYKVDTAPVIDGVIGTGEYPAVSDVSTLDDGLTLTSSNGAEDYSSLRSHFPGDYKMTTYLAYDDTYAYVAEVLETPEPVSIIDEKDRVQQLYAFLHYGLNQSKLFFEHTSNAYNNYRFKQNNTSTPSDPTGFSTQNPTAGTRILKKLESAGSKKITISGNGSVPYTAGGVTWNYAEYGKTENTAMKGEWIDETARSCRYTFEYRLPLGDILRSQDEYTASQLLAKDIFYGSFFYQVVLTRTEGNNGKTLVCISTGKAYQSPLAPLGDPTGTTKTYQDAFAEYWPASNGGSGGDSSDDYSVPFIPSQVWHVGEYDPQNPFVVHTSGVRPNLTGIGLNWNYIGVRVGTPLVINPIGDLMEVTNPEIGYQRVIPDSYQLRFNNTVVATGSIDPNHLETSIDTSKLEPGLHTLIVTYRYESFNGTEWEDDGARTTITKRFTINGTVRAANGSAAQTGDTLTWVWIAVGVMALSAAAAVIIVIAKKRRNTI